MTFSEDKKVVGPVATCEDPIEGLESNRTRWRNKKVFDPPAAKGTRAKAWRQIDR